MYFIGKPFYTLSKYIIQNASSKKKKNEGKILKLIEGLKA